MRQCARTDISDITPDKNSVICTVWAELYSYFLKQYGIESSVVAAVRDGVVASHKFVEIYLEDQVVKADATNVTKSHYDRSSMSDMTRIKLGIMPAGFRSKNFDKLSRKYQIQSLADKITEIKRLIDTVQERNQPEATSKRRERAMKIKERLKIISEQIKESKLDNMANVQYLKTLCTVFFSNEQQRGTVILNNSVYTQNQAGKCFIKPVIAINIGTSEQPKYKYIILNNKEDGLQAVQGQELIKAMSDGKLNIIKTRSQIPGLDYELIEQNKKDIKQKNEPQKKENAGHQKEEDDLGKDEI